MIVRGDYHCQMRDHHINNRRPYRRIVMNTSSRHSSAELDEPPDLYQSQMIAMQDGSTLYLVKFDTTTIRINNYPWF